MFRGVTAVGGGEDGDGGGDLGEDCDYWKGWEGAQGGDGAGGRGGRPLPLRAVRAAGARIVAAPRRAAVLLLCSQCARTGLICSCVLARAKTSDICINMPSVSRKHAALSKDVQGQVSRVCSTPRVMFACHWGRRYRYSVTESDIRVAADMDCQPEYGERNARGRRLDQGQGAAQARVDDHDSRPVVSLRGWCAVRCIVFVVTRTSDCTHCCYTAPVEDEEMTVCVQKKVPAAKTPLGERDGNNSSPKQTPESGLLRSNSSSSLQRSKSICSPVDEVEEPPESPGSPSGQVKVSPPK